MGALLSRTELLTGLLAELLTRVAADLLFALGWQGTAVLVLGTLVTRSLRGGREDASEVTHRGVTVNVACIATVLLALLLLGGAG